MKNEETADDLFQRGLSKCSKCKEIKPIKHFYKNKNRPNGIKCQYKSCEKLARHAQNKVCRCGRSYKGEKKSKWCEVCLPSSSKIMEYVKNGLKPCSKCKKICSLNCFSKCSQNKSGLKSRCKDCVIRETGSAKTATEDECVEEAMKYSKKSLFSSKCRSYYNRAIELGCLERCQEHFPNIQGGFSLGELRTKCDNNNSGRCMLYLIECYTDTEKFYKVGITSTGLTERYAGKKLQYDYRVLWVLESDPEFAFLAEKFIKFEFKGFCYDPEFPFDGCLSECFYHLPGKLVRGDFAEIVEYLQENI